MKKYWQTLISLIQVLVMKAIFGTKVTVEIMKAWAIYRSNLIKCKPVDSLTIDNFGRRPVFSVLKYTEKAEKSMGKYKSLSEALNYLRIYKKFNSEKYSVCIRISEELVFRGKTLATIGITDIDVNQAVIDRANEMNVKWQEVIDGFNDSISKKN